MFQIIAIGLAGAIGALARYGMTLWSRRFSDGPFPVGTLLVNIVGCFLLGLFLEYAFTAKTISAPWRTALTVGGLGAFTTFSTFGYETFRLMEGGVWIHALANIGLSVSLGLFAVWVGIAVGRAFG